MTSFRSAAVRCAIPLVLAAAACDGPKHRAGTVSITLNPCTPTGTVTLDVATTAVVDCSGGGTTLTLAGNGASYMIVPQFPTDQAPNALVSYQLFTGNVAAASASLTRYRTSRAALSAAVAPRLVPPGRKMFAQRAAERALRARAARSPRVGVSASVRRQLSAAAAPPPPPALGSIASFHVANSFTVNTWATVGAKLAYAGANVLVYVDTLAPANGFTPTQLTNFGQQFDQRLYPIDTTAFGGPSDIDGNGRVIMLMTPVVNADTPASQCASQGFVAGFFDSGDFGGSGVNSNNAEIFYSIVPDPSGTFSCAHNLTDVGTDVPGTFLHELQHLINYSQHVVVSGSDPSSSWLDEGMSIVAEELGSVYWEQMCPPPACRANPAQLFPDSSQGFIQDFLYDSYQYAYLPDTATITLSTDDENGFSWRGGAWLFSRWLGDQMGSTVFRQLETGPSNAITDLQQVTGQSFQTLFSNFGVALYADSLAGLPRNTAPPANRFVSRNVKQLWARLFATSARIDVPTATPLTLPPITTDTTTYVTLPGTMTFWRIDTPTSAATVTIQFSTTGGLPFSPQLLPQIAIFRLPPNQ
ncbi:MAG TPA: hypothetical protein VGI97_03590 [Gemmatimonadaceae bacterium]